MTIANIDSLSALDHFARIRGIDLCDSCPLAASNTSRPAGGPPSILRTVGNRTEPTWV